MTRTWTQSRARRWAAIAGAGLVTALAAAGCTAGDPDSPPPSSSAGIQSSTTPTPSPSAASVVVKPERPAQMDDDGAAGAEAAAQYFLELDSYIQATNDTAEWEAMSHQECEYCTNRLEQAREIAERRDVFQGGVTDVRIVRVYDQDDMTGIWPVDVEVAKSATSIVDASGKQVFTADSEVTQRRMEIGRRNDQWVIVGVGLLER